ncbi:hypothetical protein B0H13DRAFT_2674842 [Mycena leptocephala]|nr:hypothetical protein B0H13DRAFT_2674842 [Mycena leptocephala]
MSAPARIQARTATVLALLCSPTLEALLSRPNMLALLQATPTALLAFLRQAVRVAPTTAKYIAILLLVLNANSFPLVWHVRVWSAAFELRGALLWHRLTHFYLGKEAKKAALRGWYEAHLPIGVHPFRTVWTYERFVGFDDSDFNLHMSNSSYAMALDSARFRLALATFPNIFRCGGWVPLAATHFHYIREIPMLTRYEVRTTIGAWDEKWIWCISRFVKPPSKKSKSAKGEKSENGIADAIALANGVALASVHAQEGETLIPSLKTPATPLGGMSGGQTPLGGDNINGNAGEGPDKVAQALLQRAARATEEDGAVLYIAQLERLAILTDSLYPALLFSYRRLPALLQTRPHHRPPAVVLAANGFHAASASPPTQTFSLSSFSHARSANPPPPHWPAVRQLTSSMPALARFYAGGWRAVPEGERWWEDAFSACEGERKGRLGPFVGEGQGGEGKKSGLSGGLEAVRGLA